MGNLPLPPPSPPQSNSQISILSPPSFLGSQHHGCKRHCRTSKSVGLWGKPCRLLELQSFTAALAVSASGCPKECQNTNHLFRRFPKAAFFFKMLVEIFSAGGELKIVQECNQIKQGKSRNDKIGGTLLMTKRDNIAMSPSIQNQAHRSRAL